MSLQETKFHRWVLGYLLILPLLAFAATPNDREEFNLKANDIADYAQQDGVLWLKLTPPARQRLEKASADAYGKRLKVMLEGMPILKIQVHGMIKSGVIQVESPPPAVRERLDALRHRHRP